MERRIKILNGFTAIVIVLFATMQCNWLYSRYRYTLHEYQDTLYNRVLNVIETGNELRRASVNDSILVVPNMKLSVNNATHRFEFEIYTINTRLYDIKDSLTFANLARIYESEHPAGIEKHSEMTKMSCFLITSAISSRSLRSIIAPVGLFGKGSTRILVLSVIASSSS